MVQKGDKLIELDVSELVEKRASQAISVSKADAMLTQATKEKEILAKELTTKHNTAASNLKIAEMELEKLLGGKSGANSTEGKNRDMIERLRTLVETPPAEPQPLDASSDHTNGSATPALANQVDPRAYAGLVDKVRELLDVPVPGSETSGL